MTEDTATLIHRSVLPHYRKSYNNYVQNIKNKLKLKIFKNPKTKRSEPLITTQHGKEVNNYPVFLISGTIQFAQAGYYGNLVSEETFKQMDSEKRKFVTDNINKIERSVTLNLMVGNTVLKENNGFVSILHDLEQDYLKALANPEQKFDSSIVNMIDTEIINDKNLKKPASLKNIDIRIEKLLNKRKFNPAAKPNMVKNPNYDVTISKDKYHDDYEEKGREYIQSTDDFLLKFKSYKAFYQDKIKAVINPIIDIERKFSQKELEENYDNSWKVLDIGGRPISPTKWNIRRGDTVAVKFRIQPYTTDTYVGLRLRAVELRILAPFLLCQQNDNLNDELFDPNDELDEQTLSDLKVLEDLSSKQNNSISDQETLSDLKAVGEISNKRNDSVLDEDTSEEKEIELTPYKKLKLMQEQVDFIDDN